MKHGSASALVVVVVAGGVVGFISSERPIDTAPVHAVPVPPDVSIPHADIPDVDIPGAKLTAPGEVIVLRPDGARSPDPQPVRLEFP
jgi:hypothetical protein